MKNLMIAAFVLLGATVAQATSVNPCGPVMIQGTQTLMCADDQNYYQIEIQTLTSHPELCANNYREFHWADVTIKNMSTNATSKLALREEQFSFEINAPGIDSKFYSPEYSIKLENCVIPAGVGTGFTGSN